jgi:hypothetical protein
MSEDISKQLNNIQAGTDKLKESLQALNKDVPEFADGMEAGLKAVSKALPDVISSIMQLNAQNKQLASDGGKPVSILSQLASGMFSWNTAISIGTTLLVTYGGELVKWIANLVNGETKVSALTKALKTSQAVSESLIQTRLKGQKAAQNELTSLDALYRSAKGLKGEQAKKAMDMLKDQWPETFKNLTKQADLTGKVEDRYKKLTAQLVAAAQVEEAKNLISANANKILENNEKLKAESEKNAQLRKDANAADQKFQSTEKNLKNDYNSDLVPTKSSKEATDNAFKAQTLAKQLEASDAVINALTTENYNLNKVDNAQNNTIDDLVKTHGPQILNRSGLGQSDDTKPSENNGGGKPPTNNSPSQQLADPDSQAEEKAQKESADRMALLLLDGYAKEVQETNQHFDQLRELHKGNNATVEQLEKERVATLDAINKKFQTENLTKLHQYEADLNKTSKDARQEAFDQLNDDYKKQADDVHKIRDENLKVVNDYDTQILNLTLQREDLAKRSKKGKTYEEIAAIDKQAAEMDKQINDLNTKYDEAKKIVAETEKVSQQLSDKHQKDLSTLTKSFKQEDYTKEQSGIKDDIQSDQDSGNQQKEFADRQRFLDSEKKQALDAVTGQKEAEQKIRDKYAVQQKKLDKDRLTAEVATQKQYVQALDSVANAVKGIFGKNTIAAKAAFKAHQAAAAAQVIIDTRQSIMGIWSADSSIPFVGVPKAIAETAIVAAAGASNLDTILKQKPGFAQGGQFVSDGRGALLSGYSRTDNTNAYLRSGEAVVVSEAMRNPWARNLVSAINVAHGGRDFSLPNPSNGYAIGGIFTDGGNANRYYSQPMNDAKDLANTMAYQMINNFPPIYVDVKDVNNQQNILAQTVNRVNL